MEGAVDVNVWMSDFANLLEHKVSSLLHDYYDSTYSDGCRESDPIVTVRIDEKKNYAETNKNKWNRDLTLLFLSLR